MLPSLVSLAIAPAIAIDFQPIDAWLRCQARKAPIEQVCRAASASTPGGHLATLAESSFPAPDAAGELPPPSPAALSLIHKIRGWDVNSLHGRMRTLFPDVELERIPVHIVANGSSAYGDLYVRRFTFGDDGPAVAERGESHIFVNPLLVAKNYSGDVDTKAESLWRAMSHELFHVYFAAYRERDSRWSGVQPRTVHQTLALAVLNEGIGHYFAVQPKWDREGVPVQKLQTSLKELADVVARIDTTGVEQSELDEATIGPFWKKYGAISGATMAYGIARVFGEHRLREAIEQGPHQMIELYDAATSIEASLPDLPMSLRSWIPQTRIFAGPSRTQCRPHCD